MSLLDNGEIWWKLSVSVTVCNHKRTPTFYLYPPLTPKIRLNGTFSWQGLPLLCTSSILTQCLALCTMHYAVCSMHLHHFYHPHIMNVLLCISTITSHEVLLLNVLLCTSISPHRMATDLLPPTSPHPLYSLAPKSNQRRICQQSPKYLKTKNRQKWRSS